jgi:transposase
MKFEELSDEQWRFINPVLPPPAKTGRPRTNDRRTVNVILYVLTTECRWMDLPKKYGADSIAHRRLRRWEKDGVWRKIMDALISEGYSEGKLSIDKLSIDCDTIPAKKGARLSASTHTSR